MQIIRQLGLKMLPFIAVNTALWTSLGIALWLSTHHGVLAAESLELTEQEAAFLEQQPRLRVGIYPDWFPFEFVDDNGQHAGISADYLALVSEYLGIEFEIVVTPSWQQTLKALRDRELDMLSMAAFTPERSVYADFTEPYIRSPMVMVTRHDVPFLQTPSMLGEQTVGAVPGYASHEYLRNHHPYLNLVEAPSTRQGLTDVASGRLFAFVDNLLVVSYLIMDQGLVNLKVSGQLAESFDLSIAVRSDWPQLVAIMDKVLASISEQQRGAIYNHWIQTEFSTRTDYSKMLPFIMGLLVLLVGVLIHNWHLRVYRNSLQAANQKLREAEERLLLQNKTLEHLSLYDQLTKVYNRYKLNEVLSEHTALAERYAQPLSIVLFDLDHFKDVNDRFGHSVGDSVLRLFCQQVQASIRKTECFGRWGGEEFLLICPATPVEDATHLAERILDAVRQHQFPMAVQQTVSAGVAAYQPGDSVEDLIIRCDRVLYQAKQAGRDRVIAASLFDYPLPNQNRSSAV